MQSCKKKSINDKSGKKKLLPTRDKPEITPTMNPGKSIHRDYSKIRQLACNDGGNIGLITKNKELKRRIKLYIVAP